LVKDWHFFKSELFGGNPVVTMVRNCTKRGEKVIGIIHNDELFETV
jgi:hypothetical protein